MDCIDSIYAKSIHYFFMALFATLMFFILTLGIVDSTLSDYMNSSLVYIFKMFIMFGTIFVADRIIERWKIHNIICK